MGNWLRRTGGDWEGDEVGSSEGLEGLAEVRRHVHRSLFEPGARVGVDVDATLIEAHKESARHTYEGHKGYAPMLAFDAEHRSVLVDEFRAGNVSPGARAMAFLDKVDRELSELGATMRFLRSDSAWYQADVFNWCTERDIPFTITAVQDEATRAAIDQIPDEAWEPVPNTDREVAETVHSMNETKTSFRLVVQRWKKAEPDLFEAYAYHAIAARWVGSPLQVIAHHNRRAVAEDAIGDLVNGFGMARMPCGQVEANAAFFRLGTIAYALFRLLQAEYLPEELERKRVGTIRWRLYGVAAKLVETGRRVILKLASCSEALLQTFRAVRSRAYALRPG